jgi:hypothetical protein
MRELASPIEDKDIPTRPIKSKQETNGVVAHINQKPSADTTPSGSEPLQNETSPVSINVDANNGTE